MYEGFERHALDVGCALWSGMLPEAMGAEGEDFEVLWALHPEAYHTIKMHGRDVATPRWQQAYGRDYHYTGRVNRALSVPEVLARYVSWGRSRIDERLNGALLNWYDGARGHYIGKHRDSVRGMVEGTPIVTMSLGEGRIFRLRPWKGRGYRDFETKNGGVFVMPWETNLMWTHEVPRFARDQGRRISITLRAFAGEGAS